MRAIWIPHSDIPANAAAAPRGFGLYRFAGDEPLGPQWLDHPLKGDWADHRECHIGGDFLLIYKTDGDAIIFVRTGTHSELFEE